ncbi:CheR family methyltransferase [Nocardia sp. NPDC050630]|uniref:CheR family methyltransferase n=1 Tax=Nocardia sp. NPDC050630 TaxID=3364321 RepID=UPI0037958C33
MATEFDTRTEWFRSPRVWPLMVEHLRTRGRPVAVWSGACSSGEEAYSMAVTLDREGIDGTVYASDIDRRLVRTAEKGEYPRPQSPLLSDRDLHSYFAQVGRRYVVRSTIRDRVEFGTAELGVDTPPRCDIAMLRNVWRHLTEDAKEVAARAVADAIGPDGRLVLGGSDFFIQDADGTWRSLGDPTFRNATQADVNAASDTLPHALPALRAHFTPAEHPMIWRTRYP